MYDYKASIELVNARYYIRCIGESIRSGKYDIDSLKEYRSKAIKELDKALSLAKNNKFK